MTTKDVIAVFHGNVRHADFVGKAVVEEPVSNVASIVNGVCANAAVNRACLISDANHETRCTSAEFARCVRMSDAETFNQFCIEYGWLELRVDSGSDRVPSPCAIKLFHRRFGGTNRRDPIEELSYFLKWISKGGFDGVPASAEWLSKVREYIAHLKASRATADASS
ncbi:hypothetical protein DO71_5622 [Burkholderia pseudomallei]|uniref:hypothetical protein n=1 Tax=Burkholderia pseudomallei TaxID=28450 RepID=UPI0004284CE1|nr:hypothetical protein [Burkholderia pseudomallei]AIP19776.1 hypothetical protein DP63_5463 [Burkholderia pseudomallei MSHR5855]AIP41829.1 hypothetical protein DP65_3856 [Burkholderia pseudomallei MSHR5848]AIV44315.1 hypothetical protein X988_5492 [Burkholderia pseudomallei TSV 48]AJX68294.1 hypothetical protein BG19_5493 [Burkholderia pseudomallei MSHR840]KGC10804.1 hypothetical protein DO64_5704 [Burkholderia pseudomallei]